MLKVNPTLRPDCGAILKRIEKTGRMVSKSQQPSPSEPNLLGTIEIPKDLRMLEGVLPQKKYHDDSTTTAERSMAKLSSQAVLSKPMTSADKLRDSTPRLSRIARQAPQT